MTFNSVFNYCINNELKNYFLYINIYLKLVNLYKPGPMIHRSVYISLIISTIFIILFISVISCKHDPVFLADIGTICFEDQILPILQTSCGISGCHDNGTASEDFIATSYESIIKAVNPGDARTSLLYKVITDINAEHFMPPDRPLTLQQRTLIHIWIAQGAMNTKCTYASINGNNGDTLNLDTVCFKQDILPILLSSCGISGCHDAASYEVITKNEAEDRMPPPPNTALSSTQTELFYTWIIQGAFNSDCPQKSCDTTGTVEFSAQVWPIIQNNCTGCHNSSLSSGGVNLENYQQIKYYSETLRNGTPIIVGVINYLNGFSNMPPSEKMDDCTIRKIELWIDQGTADN